MLSIPGVSRAARAASAARQAGNRIKMLILRRLCSIPLASAPQ
jgi:hypothetical protein